MNLTLASFLFRILFEAITFVQRNLPYLTDCSNTFYQIDFIIVNANEDLGNRSLPSILKFFI